MEFPVTNSVTKSSTVDSEAFTIVSDKASRLTRPGFQPGFNPGAPVMLRIAGWPEGLGTNAETTRPQRVVTLAFWGEPFAWMVPRVETWLKPWAEFST